MCKGAPSAIQDAARESTFMQMVVLDQRLHGERVFKCRHRYPLAREVQPVFTLEPDPRGMPGQQRAYRARIILR